MTAVTTRAAPRGARFSPPSAARLTEIDTMVARAQAFGMGTMPATRSTRMEPPADPPTSAVKMPSHEDRITALEGRMDGVEGRCDSLETGEGKAGTVPPGNGPTAAATSPLPTMINAREVYARLSGKPSAPPAQIAAGAPIDSRTFYAAFRQEHAERDGARAAPARSPGPARR